MNYARNELAAPLDATTVGNLEFVGGADRIIVRAEDSAEHLYRATFEGSVPDVRTEGGTVRVEYPWSWNSLGWRRHSADVALNTRLPWRIRVGGGLSNLEAELGGLQLESLEIDGGACDVELTLPGPSGIVPIHIRGGVNNLRVLRPDGVAASVRVECGAGELALDNQRFGSGVGKATLASPGNAGATNRYEIVVGGGANRVSVVAT